MQTQFYCNKGYRLEAQQTLLYQNARSLPCWPTLTRLVMTYEQAGFHALKNSLTSHISQIAMVTFATSDDENGMWQALLERQAEQIPNRACPAYLDGLKKLNLPATRIPQLHDIDEVLQATTGWQTAAVPALISFGKFFKLLANKSFPVATFIRRFDDMDYIEEPDIFHEIVGHCPLFDPSRLCDVQ